MTWKTGAAIVIYAILLSALSIAGLLWLRSTSAANRVTEYAGDSGVYILTREEWSEITAGRNIQMDVSRIVWRNAFDSYYTAKSFEWLPAGAVSMCLFFLLSSLLLWAVLPQIQRRANIRILRSMKEFEQTETPCPGLDPAIQEALEEIRQKFQDHLNDYKRLNAYVSHEQKNALSVLRTTVELKAGADAVKSIDRIVDNMEDILTLSDDSTAAAAPVDAALICAAVCDSYRSQAVPIYFDFEEGQDATILAKERWIYQAVGNLIDNAVKYGSEKPIEVFVQTRHGSVIITVRDHGIGIPLERQEQIFQNRYRVHQLKRDGYGIGLSLVAHVCNLCGGFAFVESKENEGSRFYLSFPKFDGAG